MVNRRFQETDVGIKMACNSVNSKPYVTRRFTSRKAPWKGKRKDQAVTQKGARRIGQKSIPLLHDHTDKHARAKTNLIVPEQQHSVRVYRADGQSSENTILVHTTDGIKTILRRRSRPKKTRNGDIWGTVTGNKERPTNAGSGSHNSDDSANILRPAGWTQARSRISPRRQQSVGGAVTRSGQWLRVIRHRSPALSQATGRG